MLAKLAKGRALLNLGVPNLARVGWYRLRLKLGIHPVQAISGVPQPEGGFFERTAAPLALAASPVWADGPWAFGRDLARPGCAPPNWHANILTGAEMPAANRRWDQLPQFAESIGEIKTVWEASRFDWVLAFAQRAANGDDARLEQLNEWLSDWSAHNPPYCGPNWMCAQEASLRVMKLAVAALMLGAEMPLSRPLAALLMTHLRRIAPTTSYAIGQDNNHATSEAVALFIGGTWLAERSNDEREAQKGLRYADAGRKLLVGSVRRLIFEDGGFAQYSMVYHRLMLDSLSLCELFRSRFGQPPFPADVIGRLAGASDWLAAMVVGAEGDVPNIGSNDGAWLLPLGRGTFRDFRPSAALASALFTGESGYAKVDSVADMLAWLRLPQGDQDADGGPRRHRMSFPESGLLQCAAGPTRAIMVVPNPRFRPHQCDPLHLDIWHGGKPIFCDSGTYSYALDAPPPDPWLGSVAAHNCVALGDGEPMPRLSRFLLGSWLKARLESHDDRHMAASCSWGGAHHRRSVATEAGRVTVIDEIEGHAENATLRWKTPDETLVLDGNSISGASFRLTVSGNVDLVVNTRPAWVSPTYQELRPVQQIEIRFKAQPSARICTEIELQP